MSASQSQSQLSVVPQSQGEETVVSTRLPVIIKLVQIMSELKQLPKRGYNEFHKYYFLQEEDLLAAVREKLAERCIMLMPSVTNIEHLQLSRTDSNGKEKASILTTVRTRYTFVDGESGDSYSCDWAGDGEDSLDKGIYKGYTGSEKSFLIKVFLIPTCKDPERPSPQQRQGGNQAQRSNNQPRNNQ